MSKFIRLYGKKRTEKRFKALDYENGIFVDNLIYASFWDAKDKHYVEEIARDLTEMNPDYVFEVREVKS